MATTARDIVTRGLRLINVPGRGALLPKTDAVEALEALQDIVTSYSTSEQFVPGVTRHFFALQELKDVYRYGPGLEAPDFDSSLFNSGAPIRIESAYIRAGAQIIDNRLVANSRFNGSTGWTPTAPTWEIRNGQARFNPGTADVSIAAATNPTLSVDTQYTLTLSVSLNAGTIRVQVVSTPGALDGLLATIDTSGTYTFKFFPQEAGEHQVLILTSSTDASGTIDNVNLIQTGQDTLTLTRGNDYHVRLIDQEEYNRRYTKGTNGRPYEIFYSRGAGVSEVRFDNSGTAGDILVMDVLPVLSIDSLDQELPINSDAFNWLKYELAYQMAGQYGKALTRDQINIKNSSYELMAAGNRRLPGLRVDRALAIRPRFDVNRGDP